MTYRNLHRWDLSPDEAMRVQSALRDQLVLQFDGRAVKTVGGVDMSLKEDRAHAAIVVLNFPDLSPVTSVVADAPLVFPYISGLLAFREGPAVLAAWDRLEPRPDLLMFDGQGIAHPRGVGIASQIGLWIERPTIGVAKSRLFGHHDEPGPERGDQASLLDRKGNVIGTVLRSKARTNPLYISPGHLMDTPAAVQFVLACCTKYRLPKTTRWAHNVAAGRPLPGLKDSGIQPALF